jgi:hypothetical protein
MLENQESTYQSVQVQFLFKKSLSRGSFVYSYAEMSGTFPPSSDAAGSQHLFKMCQERHFSFSKTLGFQIMTM